MHVLKKVFFIFFFGGGGTGIVIYKAFPNAKLKTFINFQGKKKMLKLMSLNILVFIESMSQLFNGYEILTCLGEVTQKR